MERKPWPLIVLALLHFFEPQVKLLFYSWLWHLPVGTLLQSLSAQQNSWRTFLFLFSFPIAGIAIFVVKNWSLPVFFAIQIITLCQHLYDAAFSPTHLPIAYAVLFIFLNLVVTTYFLLPAVRVAYLDPRVRWWESKPRYQVRWPAYLTQDTRAFEATISNISEGGFFCELPQRTPLETTQEVVASFSFQERRFEVRGEFRHSHFAEQKSFYGVEFVGLPTSLLRSLKSCLRELDRLGTPRKPARENPFKSFRRWFVRLVTTGKGLLPEIKPPRS